MKNKETYTIALAVKDFESFDSVVKIFKEGEPVELFKPKHVENCDKATSYIVNELKLLADTKGHDPHKEGQVYALKMLEGYLIGNK